MFYLSLMAQDVGQLWTGSKANVSDIFRIKKLAGQFVWYDTTVKGSMDDLTVNNIDDGERKDDLLTKVVTAVDQDDTQAPKQPGLASSDTGHADRKLLVSNVNDDAQPITPSPCFFAEIDLPSGSDTTSTDHALTSSLALAAIRKDSSNPPTQLETWNLVLNLLLYA